MGCNVSSTAISNKNPSEKKIKHIDDEIKNGNIEDHNNINEINEENQKQTLKSNLNTNEILTSDQKKIIRKCWKLLSPRQVELGQKVFLRIFENSPQLKSIFSFSNINGEALTSHPLFQAHSFRFMQIIQTSVDNLDDLENGLVPVVLNLGRFHQRKAIWFSAQYFHAFENAVLYIWNQEIGDGFTSDNKNAWTVLFAFIVKWLKEGYRSGQKVTKNIYTVDSSDTNEKIGEQ